MGVYFMFSAILLSIIGVRPSFLCSLWLAPGHELEKI